MGEVFAGRYELIDPIGSGGMGTVWRVHDRRTDRIVAAKVLRQSQAADLLRFMREQSVRIQHPHVLVPLGWAGEDDRVLFTMPLVAGGSLATLVGDFGALPPLVVAEIVRQVADALSAVHAAGIVHRDLKPANVLLDATGSGRPWCYLSDFGIAAELDGPRLTQVGQVLGTPGYLAPEASAGAAPSVASDLYALGQLTLTLLTGIDPRSRAASAWSARDDGALSAPSSPDASARLALEDLARRLTRPDPAERPSSASEVIRALDVPVLTWRPDAMGDVEVFDQLPPLPQRWSDTAVRTGRDAPDRTPIRPVGSVPSVDAPPAAQDAGTPVRGAGPVTPVQRLTPPDGSAREVDGARTVDGAQAVGAPSAPRRRGVRPADVGVVLLIVAALVIGALLLTRPPASPKSESSGTGSSGTASTPAAVRSGSGNTVDPTSIGGSATAAAPTASTAPTGSAPSAPTPGGVTIAPVVVSVGQPCEASQLGRHTTTVTGTAVVCEKASDGSLIWRTA